MSTMKLIGRVWSDSDPAAEIKDETGKPIREFDVIRVFHFIGRRRKKEYMYKWVRRDKNGRLVGYHLGDATGACYPLWSNLTEDRRILGVVIIQQSKP